MELCKIEISQEDYDFIKAFISEYALDEEEKEIKKKKGRNKKNNRLLIPEII